MWIRNKKRGYKIVKYIKRRNVYVLQGQFCQFETQPSNLEKYGYRQVKSKPLIAKKVTTT